MWDVYNKDIIMAISLSAEQQTILELFLNSKQYIIPAYQRAYSWEYDQCFQLYNDIINAYNNGKEDYFLGNLIVAKGADDKLKPQLVDGQQRMLTIWIILKILSELWPNNYVKRLISVETLESSSCEAKIRSTIFETGDDDQLQDVYKTNLDELRKRLIEVLNSKGMVDERKIQSRIEANTLHLFNWFSHFFSQISNEEKKDFVYYFLNNISLLPIELSGADIDEASSKALTIFETINNRGMNLSDADIFKARLYNKATNQNMQDDFMNKWIDIRLSCEDINITIDELFRYYSHIIRGLNRITTGEENMRNFFINKPFSPLRNKDYISLIEELYKILDVLNYYQENLQKSTDLTPWLQIIEAYSNQYPKTSIIVYLYKYGKIDINSQVEFVKSIVRYAYYTGSTSTVKFEIYTVISKIMNDELIGHYLYPTINDSLFDFSSRLRKGFALMAHYLKYPKAIKYSIDNIISKDEIDKDTLSSNWNIGNFDKFIYSLGNTIVLDIPKRYITLEEKTKYYKTSQMPSVQKILDTKFTYNRYIEREKQLRSIIIKFFQGVNANNKD